MSPQCGLREDCTNHTWTLWQCVWINRIKLCFLRRRDIFMHWKWFCCYSFWLKLINNIGDDFRHFDTKFWYLKFYFYTSKIIFIVLIQNYRYGKIAIADVGKWLDIWFFIVSIDVFQISYHGSIELNNTLLVLKFVVVQSVQSAPSNDPPLGYQCYCPWQSKCVVALLNRLFRSRSKKTPKFRVTGLCVGNSPVTGVFPAQRATNAENVSIWWRHHGLICMIFVIWSKILRVLRSTPVILDAI